MREMLGGKDGVRRKGNRKLQERARDDIEENRGVGGKSIGGKVKMLEKRG